MRNYAGGEGEYKRLSEAMALGEEAASLSTSWGRFQILGDNFEAAGLRTCATSSRRCMTPSASQLKAFGAFIKSVGLVDALRKKQWAVFARGYNGPAYAENRYDEKLEAAYQGFVGADDAKARPRGTV